MKRISRERKSQAKFGVASWLNRQQAGLASEIAAAEFRYDSSC